MKIKRITSFVVTAFVLYIATLSLFHGCMETVQPEDTDLRTLRTSVFKMYDPATGELVPVRGADVTIFEEKDGKQVEIKTIQTNENGLAIFDLDIPVIGKLYSVKATYNSESQVKSSLLICKDTIVNFIFYDDLITIDCGNLNRNDTLVFYDNEGSERLKKNTPLNINKYERCVTYTVGNANSGPIEFQLPTVPAPYEITGIYIADKPVNVNTKTVSVAPGEAITICYSVSTANAGIFQNTLPINVRCADRTTGVLNLVLQSEVVEPSCDCEDVKDNAEIIVEERVQVGETFTFENMEVFVNNTACTVVISQAGANLSDGWTITSPTFPVTLAKGEVLSITGKFTPGHSGTSNGELNLTINPQGTSYNCPFDLFFEGEGCSPVCPFIGLEGRLPLEQFGTRSPYADNISNRTDDRVFISVPGLNSIASKLYYFENPDSSCGEVTISVEIIPADNYARTYFSVTPSRLTLLPGETGQVEVMFTAPTLQELTDILQARKGSGPYTAADSSFSVRLKLVSNNCQQLIDLTAMVTAFPDISPIINLRAYDQRTTLKPNPENEVYYFGYGSRTIIKSPDGSNGPYPPSLGNIWIDVTDNQPSANPPQEPILKLVDNAIEIKLWQRNYPELKFSDVPTLVTEFAQDPMYNVGYGPGPITGIAVEDVYAIKFDDMTFALMFIRRVDNGTENTSSKQSGIEFRAIYPIYIY
ncbi:MAG: hypothetical protein V1779_10160 [bacterium]